MNSAEILNLAVPDDSEWTHPLALEFYGEAGQKKSNLVLATKACNTTMMHLEYVIRKLILLGHRLTPDVSVHIDTSNEDSKKYHRPLAIDYQVQIDDHQPVK
ncbi:MAG: hypothetical protein ACK4PR_12780, partial [Gammaproteobacteria bacterium]